MKQDLYDTVWGLGIRARNLAKRAGVLGRFEPLLLKMAPLLIRPPSKEVEIVVPSDRGEMRMTVPPGYPAARSFAAGLYERDVTRLFEAIVTAGMTVVDVGANVGYYTLIASRLAGPAGRVYAFEPDPRIYAYLVRNVESNGCSNVVAVNKAVSEMTGSGTFIPDEHGAEGRLSASSANRTSIAVQTVNLDDYFAGEGWPSIAVIKMDIEGGERAALDGMRELCRRNPEMQLIMEFNLGAIHRAGGTREELASLLQELGFSKGHIIEQDMKPFSVPHQFPKSHATYDLLLTGAGTPYP